MNAKFAAAAALTFGVVSASPALAQESTGEVSNYFEQKVSAPTEAFELTIGSGYTQGVGLLQSGVGMPSVATPGLAIDLGAMYRMDCHWALGIIGQYQELTAERALGARGVTGGATAVYHFSPDVRLDPFIQFGTGYRLLWEERAGQSVMLTHGFELARAVAGLDLRLAPEVAIAPVIGADLNLFLWQDHVGKVAIPDPRLNTFVFAGVQGRFELGATYKAENAASR